MAKSHPPEILAPAGSPDAANAAIDAGADAIYLGAGELNARRGAYNATPEILREIVQQAHASPRRPTDDGERGNRGAVTGIGDSEGAGEGKGGGGVRVHLALNIDLRQRELGLAARWLALAADAGVDAMILRDPAVFALARFFGQDFPEVHASTQTAPLNRADLVAAGHLGAVRAVLARELSLDEIEDAGVDRAASRPPVALEVFAQGALCHCVSGRCLLSSWGGGRSGNRGACVSPCRVPWTITPDAPGARVVPPPPSTPMSMIDLAALEKLPDLVAAGVGAFKIEGRLKSASWVAEAVRLYRQALDRLLGASSPADGSRFGGEQKPPDSGQPPAGAAARSEDAPSQSPRRLTDGERRRLAALGAYAGRRIGAGYLDGRRDNLIAEAERPAAAAIPAVPATAPTPVSASVAVARGRGDDTPPRLAGEAAGRRLIVRFDWRGRSDERFFPKTVVRREKKALPLGDVLAACREDWPENAGPPPEIEIDDPDFLVPPRTANAILDQCATWRNATLARTAGSGGEQGYAGGGGGGRARRSRSREAFPPLPPLVAEALAALALARPAPENRPLAGRWRPDRLRLDANSLDFWRDSEARRGVADIVVAGLFDGDGDGVSGGAVRNTFESWRSLWAPVPVVASLPAVIFPPAWPRAADFLRHAARRGWTVEANSWGVAAFCRELMGDAGTAASADFVWEAGPGLGVLNTLAAAVWRDWGARSVVYSVEADRPALEEMAAVMDTPADIIVYGRPPLATSRTDPPSSWLDATWTDRRGIRLRPRREDGLVVFRPVEAFDWTDLENPRIRARHRVADLRAAPDPSAEWRRLRQRAPALSPRLRFNYERGLR